MSLTPLLQAQPPIPLHAFAALFALALGVAQLAAAKGTPRHRALGWLWVAIMAVTAISSFWINEMRVVGPFGPIHLLSILTLGSLVVGVRAARRGNIAAHRAAMRSLFFFALVLAGAFTLLPGRIMHAVIFGG